MSVLHSNPPRGPFGGPGFLLVENLLMIHTKTDMNSCYKAIRQFDEAEAVLLRAIDIMASMCTRDVYNALDRLKDRRDEFDTAIRRFRKGAQAPSLPGTVSEFLDGREEARWQARIARISVKSRRDPWDHKVVRRDVDDVEDLRADLTQLALEVAPSNDGDAGVESLRSDLTEVAFEEPPANHPQVVTHEDDRPRAFGTGVV